MTRQMFGKLCAAAESNEGRARRIFSDVAQATRHPGDPLTTSSGLGLVLLKENVKKAVIIRKHDGTKEGLILETPDSAYYKLLLMLMPSFVAESSFRDMLKNVLSAHGFGKDDLIFVQAIQEALINALDVSVEMNKAAPIKMELTIKKGLCEVIIVNKGRPFSAQANVSIKMADLIPDDVTDEIREALLAHFTEHDADKIQRTGHDNAGIGLDMVKGFCDEWHFEDYVDENGKIIGTRVILRKHLAQSGRKLQIPGK